MTRRSHCPIVFALDLIGDKWSLLILRDIILMDKKFYKDFSDSQEGISTNILADRLAKLEKAKIIFKKRDSVDKKRFIYSPTEKGLDLIPMMLAMVLWSGQYDKKTAVQPDVLKRLRKDPKKFAENLKKQFR